MSIIIDSEFGEITLRKVASASSIRLRVAPNGRLSITHPPLTPKLIIKRFLDGSRDEIRNLHVSQTPAVQYQNGSIIGKSHTLLVRETSGAKSRITTDGQQIVLSLAAGDRVESEIIQRLIRDEVIKALRVEAKRYLPRRLKYLAEQGGFSYERVRFSHASSRWGSCSSTGTISLNIALMKLPFELIDYVIIHELCHTRHMNHSTAFWAEVGRYDEHYKLHRRHIKAQTPTI